MGSTAGRLCCSHTAVPTGSYLKPCDRGHASTLFSFLGGRALSQSSSAPPSLVFIPCQCYVPVCVTRARRVLGVKNKEAKQADARREKRGGEGARGVWRGLEGVGDWRRREATDDTSASTAGTSEYCFVRRGQREAAAAVSEEALTHNGSHRISIK